MGSLLLYFLYFILGCLIPCIKNNTVCLYYIQIPFDDDVKGFTLENFNLIKKYNPTEKQLDLIDDLIDSMDLTKKSMNDSKADENGEDEEDEDTELYDPHTTINPYIQRMFQSIAFRATNPSQELPNFETHITSTHLTKIGEKIRNDRTLNLLKRCAEEFTLKEIESKKSKTQDESMFDKKKESDDDANKLKEENDMEESATGENFNLDELLNSKVNQNKVKKVGTITPVDDFKLLAERIMSNLTLKQDEASNQSDFEDLCIQIQAIIKEFFNESLLQYSALNEDDLVSGDTNVIAFSFQKKAFECIRIQREYCLKFKSVDVFNSFLKTFKIYLLNESNNKKYASQIEKFWQNFFINSNVSFITGDECTGSEISEDEAQEFVKSFKVPKAEVSLNVSAGKDNEDDLLDLM